MTKLIIVRLFAQWFRMDYYRLVILSFGKRKSELMRGLGQRRKESFKDGAESVEKMK